MLRRGSTGREPQQCPRCKTELNAHANVAGQRGPRPGDYEVCLFCKAIMKVDVFYRLKLIPEAQRVAIMRDPNVRKAIAIVEELHRENRVTG